MHIPDRLRSADLGRHLAPAVAEATKTVAEQRRRGIVVAVTLVVGTVLLALAFSRPAGSTGFYVLAAVLAAVWLGGGLLSGPPPLGARVNTRQIIGPRW